MGIATALLVPVSASADNSDSKDQGAALHSDDFLRPQHPQGGRL